jgi:hypothetical protein
VGWGYETGRALMFMVMANCKRTRTRRRAENLSQQTASWHSLTCPCSRPSPLLHLYSQGGARRQRREEMGE